MDKYEYKVKLDQIEKLASKKDFITAAKIADSIDWRKVKSPSALNLVAAIYEETQRFEECLEILSILYNRSPIGRSVVYHMAEVAVKMNDLDKAAELYKEFIKIAPNDLNKYLLKYRICRGRGAAIDEQIAILEEYKSHEYDEYWAYELACLYEEAERIDQCVEACDELILWFSEGEYVIKAMELKMRYQELTASQLEKYEKRFEYAEAEDVEENIEALDDAENEADGEIPCDEEIPENVAVSEETEADPEEVKDREVSEEDEHKTLPEEDDTPTVSEVNVNKFSTMNLQKELAEGLRQLLEQEEAATEQQDTVTEEAVEGEPVEVAITQEFIPMKEAVWVLETEVAEESEQEVEAEAPEVMEEVETAEEEVTEETVVTEEADETEKTVEEAEEFQSELLKYISKPQEENLEKYLSVDEDGQLSLIVDPKLQTEKQITGQLSIEEILEAWEEKKRREREKMEAALQATVLCETGEITGLLEDFIPKTPKEVEVPVDEESAVAEEPAIEELIMEETMEEETEAEEPMEEVETEEPMGEEVKAEEPMEEAETEESAVAEEPAELVDDLPQDIDGEEAEEVSEEEKPRSIGQNTAAMLDAIERALAQEIIPLETAGNYFTEEQEKIFAYFTSVRGMKKQLLTLLEEEKSGEQGVVSSTGNLVITGHPGNGKTTLAIDIVKVFQKQRGIKGGKIAKVTGDGLNKKNPQEVLQRIGSGALIIERAGNMKDRTIELLTQAMESHGEGVLVILEDSSEKITALLRENESFARKFNRSIEIPIFSNDELVAFGKSYAEEQEFYFDDMAVLALYDCIGVRQTADHVVNVAEVKEIIDDAIVYAKKRGKSLFARLSRKGVDEDGNRLLLEEDFHS